MTDCFDLTLRDALAGDLVTKDMASVQRDAKPAMFGSIDAQVIPLVLVAECTRYPNMRYSWHASAVVVPSP
jgi:hypothetical protein